MRIHIHSVETPRLNCGGSGLQRNCEKSSSACEKHAPQIFNLVTSHQPCATTHSKLRTRVNCNLSFFAHPQRLRCISSIHCGKEKFPHTSELCRLLDMSAQHITDLPLDILSTSTTDTSVVTASRWTSVSKLVALSKHDTRTLQNCKSGKPRKTCKCALCTVDDTCCFHDTRLGPKPPVKEVCRCQVYCNKL